MATIDGSLLTDGTVAAAKFKGSAEILRSQQKQVANVKKGIPAQDWRVWDSGAVLPTAAAADDLGIDDGTLATTYTHIQAGDLKAAGATTRYALTHVALPDYYDDANTVQVRLHAGMVTTVADTSCTIDVQAYELGDNGAASSDLCTTAAQSMNSLTAADLDFTITETALVAGDVLEIRIAIACNDGATGTAVIPTLWKSWLLFDARG